MIGMPPISASFATRQPIGLDRQSSSFAALVSSHEPGVGDGASDSVMDRVGSALKRLDDGTSDLADLAGKVSVAGPPKPSDLVMLSVKCTRVMLEAQLVSNIASRTSDGIQQMFRQQS